MRAAFATGLLAAGALGAVRTRRIHAPPARETPVWLYAAPRGAPGGVLVPGTEGSVVPVAAPLPDAALPPGWAALDAGVAAAVPKFLVHAPAEGDGAVAAYLARAGTLSAVPGTARYRVFATRAPETEWIPAVRALELAQLGNGSAAVSAGGPPHGRCAHTALLPLPRMGAALRRRVAEAATPVRVGNDAEKALLMGAVGTGDAEALLRQLSGADPARSPDTPAVTFTTRMSTSTNNREAAEWIGATLLTARACDDVEYQEFLVSGSTTRNVICIRHGTTKPEEVVVVGAHFDSIPGSGSAPGAIDNGSGSVGVMLAALALADATFERTMHFICFSGEEQGLHGSRHYVEEALDDGRVIPAAITMDMTGYSSRYFGVAIEGTRDSSIEAVMYNANDNLALLKSTPGLGSSLTQQYNWNSFGSDHVPFQQGGYAGILLIEQDDTNYPGYHRATDQVNYANWEQLRDIARIAVGQAVDYAGLVSVKK